MLQYTNIGEAMQSNIRYFNTINLNTGIPIKENILLLEYERLYEYDYNTELKEPIITKELLKKIF